jgi:molecular chaperone DnaK
MYAEQAQAGATAEQGAGGAKPADEDVVDAEFEEVKEDQK